MEARQLHLLLAQPHHPRLPGLLPNHPTRHLPASRLRLHLNRRRPKRLAAAPSRSPPGSQANAPGRSVWEWVLNAAAALVLQLAVCSLLFLFPSRVRANALPPPPAATVEEEVEEEDKEWEAALQKWKTKTYALSVPLRVVALRGSFPPSWIKDFVEAQGKRLKFNPELRPSLDGLFSEMSQCLDKGQVQPKSAMAADVVSIGDSWLGYAIRKGLVEPVENAEEHDWFRSLSDRWKVHLCRNQNGEADPNGSVWGVPDRWGAMVIAYKKNKLKRHNLKPMQDWEDLWSLKTLGRFQWLIRLERSLVQS